jgi:hypothetical protein
LDWARFNEEHDRCFRFLDESIKRSTAQNIIVVSHHVPSYKLGASEFKGSRINGAFTVELGDYIASNPINYWIYGHSHRNINHQIGETQCVSNQLGYVFAGEPPNAKKPQNANILRAILAVWTGCEPNDHI